MDVVFVAYLCHTSAMKSTSRGKTQTIRARVAPELKRGAEAVLRRIGLTSSQAITLFLTQVKLTKGLPFPVGIPNKETQRALKDARTGKNIETFESVSAWAKKVRAL
jgi:DNA-damage-inducible protein J